MFQVIIGDHSLPFGTGNMCIGEPKARARIHRGRRLAPLHGKQILIVLVPFATLGSVAQRESLLCVRYRTQ